jgi:hypothetical protein
MVEGLWCRYLCRHRRRGCRRTRWGRPGDGDGAEVKLLEGVRVVVVDVPRRQRWGESGCGGCHSDALLTRGSAGDATRGALQAQREVGQAHRGLGFVQFMAWVLV